MECLRIHFGQIGGVLCVLREGRTNDIRDAVEADSTAFQVIPLDHPQHFFGGESHRSLEMSVSVHERR